MQPHTLPHGDDDEDEDDGGDEDDGNDEGDDAVKKSNLIDVPTYYSSCQILKKY